MTTEAYPLQWPIGWPRTPAEKRGYGRFSTKGRSDYGNWQTTKHITISQAVGRILDEIRAFSHSGSLDPETVVISTNLKVRNDGRPKSGQRMPEDPGVAVYFELEGKPQCIPCDAYTKVEQNLAAVAATLSALRTLERHGSGIMERAFTGFEALPHLAEDPWWVVLQLPSDDVPWAVIDKQYRVLRSDNHPDRGGHPDQFDRIQKAYQEARKVRGEG